MLIPISKILPRSYNYLRIFARFFKDLPSSLTIVQDPQRLKSFSLIKALIPIHTNTFLWFRCGSKPRRLSKTRNLEMNCWRKQKKIIYNINCILLDLKIDRLGLHNLKPKLIWLTLYLHQNNTESTSLIKYWSLQHNLYRLTRTVVSYKFKFIIFTSNVPCYQLL